MIKGLIISCNLPRSLVDSFITFTSVVDARYCPVSREHSSTHTAECANAFSKGGRRNVEFREGSDCLCHSRHFGLTGARVDFLGVTAPFIKMEEETSPKLQSALLSCDRFTGSHTGEIIKKHWLERIIWEDKWFLLIGNLFVDKSSVYFSSKQRP